MSVSMGLVLLGGVLLILGMFRTRKSLRNSSSALVPKAILVLGVAFWITAGGHALLVNASTDTSSTQQQRGIHPQTAAKAQTDRSLPRQKDARVALEGKIVGIKNGQHNAPTYLLIARNGNENKLVSVRVDSNSALGRGVALNHNVTVRGTTSTTSATDGYKDVPTVSADRVIKNDFSNRAA